MPSRTFLYEIRCRKTFIWNFFFGITCIFGSIWPKSECNFSFLYNLLFQLYHLSRLLAPLREEIDVYPRGLSCPKFDAEKLLFEAFFGIMGIFGSVQPKVSAIFRFCTKIISSIISVGWKMAAVLTCKILKLYYYINWKNVIIFLKIWTEKVVDGLPNAEWR